MKSCKIFLILCLFFGCSKQKEVFEFESILGQENSKTLTLLTKEFENNYLNKFYSNSSLSESYKQFLIDYENGILVNKNPFPKQLNEIFNSSSLKKEMYYHPDSVWVLPNSSFDRVEEDSLVFLNVDTPYLKIRKKDLIMSNNNRAVYTYERYYSIIDSTTNLDSLIRKTMNIRLVNYTGKYVQALHRIRSLGGFYESFSDLIFTTNDKDSLCRLIIKKADLDEELVRKLIVLELVL